MELFVASINIASLGVLIFIDKCTSQRFIIGLANIKNKGKGVCTYFAKLQSPMLHPFI
jgi:hypothetical protein